MNEYNMRSITQRMLRIGKEAWNDSRGSLNNEKLSNIQYNIAYVILNNPGISQDGISTYLHLDKSSVAKLIVKLIDMGYVIREVNQDDKRQYQLYLTEKGKEEIEELNAILISWEEKTFHELDSETYKMMNDLLTKIEDKIF